MEEQLLASPGGFAAVIIDPVQETLPADGFLSRVRELATRHGALLIFDEMVTGFRIAPGGAQQAFGAAPDLACFGKALANGLPLSALVGKAEFMRLVPAVGFDLTFRGEALSLAAARACLRIYQREPVSAHVAHAGETVRGAFDRACERTGIPWRLTGHPCRMYFQFRGGHGISAEGARALFLQECLKRGVLHHGFLLPCYALDDDAIEQSSQALPGALETVAGALHDGNLQGRLRFEAPPHFFSGA
jgi:glutamate-1-semialdehyde aminotransferase